MRRGMRQHFRGGQCLTRLGPTKRRDGPARAAGGGAYIAIVALRISSEQIRPRPRGGRARWCSGGPAEGEPREGPIANVYNMVCRKHLVFCKPHGFYGRVRLTSCAETL